MSPLKSEDAPKSERSHGNDTSGMECKVGRTSLQSGSKCRQKAAIFSAPLSPGSGIVVGIVNHLTLAFPCRWVAHSVRIRAVVETSLVLAAVAVVARIAHASAHGELDAAPPVEAAVSGAIYY